MKEEKTEEKLSCGSTELSREEYLRLLTAAKSLGKERTYLAIKLFVCTGIRLQYLSELTVEQVEEGTAIFSGVEFFLPEALRQELIDFSRRRGIKSGLVFRTRNGTKIDRSNLHHEIHFLADKANVDPQKCNPRSLRRLYQRTQKKLRDEVELLVEQKIRRIMENEQALIGWDVSI